jgi:hypothetical protein
VWGTWLRRAAALLAVLAGSQLGHALVYTARYGAAAGRYQSAGVHAYLPSLTAGIGAGIGVVLVTGLLLVAAARSTSFAPGGFRPRRTVRFLDVLALAFVAQVVLFVGQETVEALAAGQPAAPLPEQLLWGAFGQLPAALVAAATITWLLTRLEAAWTALAEAVPKLLVEPFTPAAWRLAWPAADGRLRLGSAFPAAFRKRGPPPRVALT